MHELWRIGTLLIVIVHNHRCPIHAVDSLGYNDPFIGQMAHTFTANFPVNDVMIQSVLDKLDEVKQAQKMYDA